MPRTLRYTDEAVADLDAIRRWQTQPGSGEAAIRRVKAIRTAVRTLLDVPCLYAISDHPGLRELICQGHIVIYSLHPDTGRNDTAGDVTVLRIFGPRRLR